MRVHYVRATAGYEGPGDCAIRAIAIAEDRPYNSVWLDLLDCVQHYKETRWRGGDRVLSDPVEGIDSEILSEYLAYRGWRYVPCQRPYPSIIELPKVRRWRILSLRAHVLAIWDRSVYDTSHPSSHARSVFGYWEKVK